MITVLIAVSENACGGMSTLYVSVLYFFTSPEDTDDRQSDEQLG